MSLEAELDRKRLQDRQKFARGRAKVNIANLEFHSDIGPGQRRLDTKNVARLVGVFVKEGCLRLDSRNYIQAIIPNETLQESLQQSQLNAADLLLAGEPKMLKLGSWKLQCLHGKHRIAAARQILDPFDQWWVVDLYIPGMLLYSGMLPFLTFPGLDDRTLLDMREEYINASNFSHGDIYRNLRYHQQRGDQIEAGRWMVRLTPGLQTDLGRF